MQEWTLQRRQWLALAGAGLLSGGLSGCSERPAFAGLDITGAHYATDFDLTDHNGQRRTLADFRGQVVVIFFGFVQCPDVCPTALAEMAQAKALLGEQGERFQGLFVSVDPQRDTPEIMREYLSHFDPSFLALYTSLELLPELARSFRIYYKKIPGPTPTSYTMDHSAGSYMYDTQGRIRLYHRHNGGAQALASDARILLAEAGPS